MISTLNFYQVPFSEEENKLIENIELFLTRNTGDTIESEYAIDLGSLLNFQFQKHDINLEIKINASELKAPLFKCNYVVVRNQEEAGVDTTRMKVQHPFYYFVKSVTSVGESTLKLTLRMDTLNTYGKDLIDTQNWSPSTMVEREHRDRFFDDPNSSFSHTEQYNRYAIKVDKISEGIHFPMKVTSNSAKIDTLASKFYLVYRSAFAYSGSQASDDELQSKNAIKCFLVAQKGKHIPIYNYHGNARDVSLAEDLLSSIPNVGDMLVFDTEDNPDLWYEVGAPEDGKRYYNGTNLRYAINNGYNGYVGIYRATSSVVRIFTILIKKNTGTSYATFTEYYAGGAIRSLNHVDDSATQSLYAYDRHRRSTETNPTLANRVFHKARKAIKFELGTNPGGSIPTIIQSWSNWQTGKSTGTEILYAENVGIQSMMTIDQVDRTDSRLIKIIELPYAPNAPVANGSGANLHYTFGSNWSTSADYDENNQDMANAFQLVGDIEPEFSHVLANPIAITGTRQIHAYTYVAHSMVIPWKQYFETKLQHSDFTKYMMLYDNSSSEIKLENLFNRFNYWADPATMPQYDSLRLEITFTASSNMTNGVLFSLDYNWDGEFIVSEGDYESEDAYPLTLVVIRNNEVNIYNASYLNYIRSGYNYDVKNKSLTLKASSLAMEQQLGNAVISSAFSMNPAGAVGGLIRGLYNYDMNKQQLRVQAQQLQNSIDKSLAQYAIQGTSVAGSDNLSLFNKYSGNTLRDLRMEVPQIYMEQIARLMHYFGYETNLYKVPNFTGRCFFNYVKCQPALINFPWLRAIYQSRPLYMYNGINEKLFEDAIQRFKAGVFIIHRVEPNEKLGNTADTWNISMDKENWENFILEDLVLPTPEPEEEVEENA